jgi:hypothetical protein
MVMWKNKVNTIVKYSEKLLDMHNIKSEVVHLDYVTIFPVSVYNEKLLHEELENEAVQVKVTKTGIIYKLNKPYRVNKGNIVFIRVRVFDISKKQLGYVDYQVNNYINFKDKYINSLLDITYNNEGLEMLMISDHKVLVYFPEKPFQI